MLATTRRRQSEALREHRGQSKQSQGRHDFPVKHCCHIPLLSNKIPVSFLTT